MKKYTTLLLLLSLASVGLRAEVRLPKIVGDSMVIQRDAKVKIWGWATKGERIKVKFKGKNYSATTDASGNWFLWLPPSKAGGPYDMSISGAENTITLRDILIGDVWLCAGQSNMVHNLELHKARYLNDIAAANYPQIRHFLVPTHPVLSGAANDLPEGSWKAADPKNVLRFSVVAYFFGKKLYDKYKVPIGLINTSVGGTPIEAWTSEDGLRDFREFMRTIESNKDTARVNQLNREAAKQGRAIAMTRQNDAGMLATPKWYEPDFEPKNWSTIAIPGYWEDQGINNLNGVVWYRREFELPAAMAGVPAHVELGRIVDADFFYINGTLIGNKTYQYPQRRYDVPAGVLKPGKNVFVVRVINQFGKGGFVPDKPYYLAAAGDTVDLKGYWTYKVGEVYKPLRPTVTGVSAQNQPTALYNGMLAPFTSFALKGAIWYQGESNAGRPKQYAELLPALIKDWRKQWNQPELPVLFAQLPNFMEVDYLPSESQWAELRESQRKSLSVPNTGMAVTIDLGEWNDIHPGNKKPVGERLALAAMQVAYGDNIVYTGPFLSKAIPKENKTELHFTGIGSGLLSSDGEPLRWFAVAGEDRKFVWAKASIEGEKVILTCDEVPHPAHVRYAWADNPEKVNFYNKEGLPASPFEVALFDASALWHGKRAAVVLTYDDALDVHLDHVIPALDSLGLKGSFYLSAAFPGSKNRLADWKRAAQQGHELGNHTLFHPCDGSGEGRSWVASTNDLSKYTTAQIVREIEMTNVFLHALDGKRERTFAYTCGDTATGEGSFIEAIKDQFVSMRGVRGEVNKLETLDLRNLNCYAVDNGNADQLVAWAERARAENALLVVLFHGVGGGHNLNVDLKKHNEFLSYLKNHSESFWVTTLLDASKHAVEQSKLKP